MSSKQWKIAVAVWSCAGAVLLGAACGESSTDPLDGTRADAAQVGDRIEGIVAVSALTQTGEPDRPVADPPTVQVVDTRGRGVPGVVVDFRILSGGGMVGSSTRRSDRDGHAGTKWRLGPTETVNVLRASIPGREPVDFTVHTGGPVAAELVQVAGGGQEGQAGEPLGQPLEVRVLDAAGEPMAGHPVSWRVIAGGGSIQAMQPESDAAGIASAVWTLGSDSDEQRAVAESGDLSSPAFVATVAGSSTITSVEITPANLTLDAVGEEAQLTAMMYDADGERVPGAVTWSSTDASVATVSGSGVVRSQANGTTGIVATASNGRADTADVTVEQVVRTVTVEPSSAVIEVGDAIALDAAAFDANGYGVPGVNFQWASSSPDVAPVDAAGTVSGAAEGQATIEATGAGETGTAVVTVEATPTPSPGGVVFHSDWSTMTGRSDAAVRDTEKARPWDLGDANSGLEVVSAAGLGFPTTNVLRVMGGPSLGRAYHVRIDPDAARPIIPSFEVGDHLYIRWYWRFAHPNWFDPNDDQYHPNEDGGHNNGWGGSRTNWQHLVTGVNTDGTYRVRFDVDATASPNDIWSPGSSNRGVLLQKDRTYRYEVHLYRSGPTTFQMQVRLYDGSGTLLYGEGDWNNRNGSRTMADRVDLDINVLENFRGLQLGINGWGGEPPSSRITWAYIGAVAICTDTWCGPYSGGI